MNPALFIAKTGADAQQTRLGVVANNLANASTTGFKRDRAAFADLLYQNVKQVGANVTQNTTLPSGLNLGTGTTVLSTQKIHTQGNIVQTNNSLDVAISGKGFFQILRQNGDVAYTRDGDFQLDANGQLVTNNGDTVQPGITIPTNATSVSIGNDGTVSVQTAGNAGSTQVGNLQLADFVNPAGLQPIGGNLFLETGASGSPQSGTPGDSGLGQLTQGSLESSNVNVVQELVDMIETQRAYEVNARAISTADQMLQYTTNNL